jgi:hypothetical protein
MYLETHEQKENEKLEIFSNPTSWLFSLVDLGISFFIW